MAAGGWLTAVTLIDTVASGDVTVPSLTVKVKESGPSYPDVGVYVAWLPARVTVP